jgi:hypothetical protein
MENHSRAEWILLSVRDTSLILLPTYEQIGKGIALTHAIVIPLRPISRIVLHANFTFLSQFPMSLFGAGLGAAVKACNCDDRLYHIAIGFAAGWTIGGLLFFLDHFKEDSYYPWIYEDRERLRSHAVYPVEPYIMQYIH